jgi:hypothetical protein
MSAHGQCPVRDIIGKTNCWGARDDGGNTFAEKKNFLPANGGSGVRLVDLAWVELARQPPCQRRRTGIVAVLEQGLGDVGMGPHMAVACWIAHADARD